MNDSGTVRQSDHTWKPPDNGVLKINFDASYIDKNMFSGWGLISRDVAGNSSGLQGGACSAIDPEQAEAHALLESVIWAKQKGWRKIVLEGDCQNVMTAANGKSYAVKWTTQNVVKDAIFLLSSFVEWKCKYVRRFSYLVLL
ncbi:uncharacterized protein LOC113316203 [Papaver somniferum]|uniref:uncharacterized protein LOC113316203 n=1 Tax=Papaver somniferum TaxID=3469 RepID=UPI000E6F5D60|nr:uncharacterized protein LOC113316203 [Papaver somniferum]